ncbi:MAG: hypothetical protein IPM79_19510 [Polyangiaceae bacterium]|nr:hypothetical protein [Polyangiaceae bacterium]
MSSETRVLFDYFAGPVSAHAAAGVKLRADTGSFACDPDARKTTAARASDT